MSLIIGLRCPQPIEDELEHLNNGNAKAKRKKELA